MLLIEIFSDLHYLLLVIFALILLGPVLDSKYGRARLYITQQQVLFTKELLGFKYNLLRPARKQDVLMLIRTWQLGEKVIKPGIIIWVGPHRIEIGIDGILSAPEADWLAYELSNWLGLPITKE